MSADDSAPGTYGDSDPYIAEYGVRERYNSLASDRFRTWMRLRRSMIDLTQADLAERMTKAGTKFHDSTVANIENGKRKVTLDEAELIGRVLGVDMAYMLSLDYPDDLREWVDAEHAKKFRIRSRDDET